MSISGALSNALTGMSAASRRAELTSNNIANASTEGYASQSIGSSSVVVAGRGAGVQLGAVERAGDPRLTASRRDADAQAGASAAQAGGSRDLADALGGPPSLFDRLSAFENTLRGISENPESTALQERAVTAAGSVVSGFGDVSDSIAAVRTQADTDIGRAVDTVNAALAQVKELNIEIQNARATDRNVASFEQARDDQLDIVAEYLPIRLMPRDGGAVAVRLRPPQSSPLAWIVELGLVLCRDLALMVLNWPPVRAFRRCRAGPSRVFLKPATGTPSMPLAKSMPLPPTLFADLRLPVSPPPMGAASSPTTGVRWPLLRLPVFPVALRSTNRSTRLRAARSGVCAMVLTPLRQGPPPIRLLPPHCLMR